MFVSGEVDWKLKFPAKGNKAAQEIRPWDGCTVPSVQKQKDGLHCNPN